jgi:predicted GNAT family acetyltransferase
MPDMLARLYDLPDVASHYRRASDAGFNVRRADPWDRDGLRHFVKEQFGPLWAVEADRAFIHDPITAYLATKGGEIAGFAAYECTRRGYFGPTGVREDLRGNGLGAALLFRCLESMREMGYAYAVIGGVGPAAFYEKIVSAFVIPGSEVGVYGFLHEVMSQPDALTRKEKA